MNHWISKNPMAFKIGSEINLLGINVKTADNVSKEAGNIWKWQIFLNCWPLYYLKSNNFGYTFRINQNREHKISFEDFLGHLRDPRVYSSLIKPNLRPRVPLWESKYFLKISRPKDYPVCLVSALFEVLLVTFRTFISVLVFSRLQIWESLKKVLKMSEGMFSGVFFMSADSKLEIRHLNQSESKWRRKNWDLIGSLPLKYFLGRKIIFQFSGLNHRTAKCGKSFTTDEYN